MAKCKRCNAKIPDGMEYCKDCLDKEKASINESYLDSLLNSVKDTTSSIENNYRKKNVPNIKKNKPNESEKKSEFLSYTKNSKDLNDNNSFSALNTEDEFILDENDLEDFEQFDLKEDLKNLDQEFIIGDEDLFGEKISKDIISEQKDQILNQGESEAVKGSPEENSSAIREELTRQEEDRLGEIVSEEEPLEEEAVQEEFSEEEKSKKILSEEEAVQEKVSDKETSEEEPPKEELSMEGFSEDIVPEKGQEIYEDTSMDKKTDTIEASVPKDTSEDDTINLEELLSSLSSSETQGNEDAAAVHSELELDNENGAEAGILDNVDDDYINILNQMSSDEPEEDVKAINELLQSSPELDDTQKKSPSSVGEVFSDALQAVTSLKDYDVDEESILNGITDAEEAKNKNAASKKREKKKKEKSGVSIWKRLFGNIKDEKTAKEHKEKLKAQEQEIEEPKIAEKGGEETSETKEKKRKASEKAEAKKAAKNEKKEKKKKAKEVIQVIDEIDEDPGRINRLGAVIVFIFFVALVMVLLLGTKVVSYSLSIQYATSYFDNKKYTQAYNEVYGEDIKDKDIVIYTKIMTVMFVNKQLNSYNNYYAMKMYPEALDSLLKGLGKYDKYIEFATLLGIDSDLNYVRSQLLAELDNVYHLSEKEALDIINIDNTQDYSIAVYNAVQENINQ